jgi:KRAB domain-containing zinc finger protein
LVKRHVRTVHLKIRPVVCPECGQSFATKFHLKTHQNIHTGQKPYSCPDCPKTFSNPSSRHHHRVRYHGYVQSWRHYGDKTEKS